MEKKKYDAPRKTDAEKRDDYRAEMADKFIHVLEEEPLTWRQEWKSLHTENGIEPFNPVSGNVYSGVNAFYLNMVMLCLHTKDPRFVTFNQIADFKHIYHPKEQWHLHKGSTHFTVTYPYPYNMKQAKSGNKELRAEASRWTWESMDKAIRSGAYADTDFVVKFHYSNVFSATMIDGMAPFKKPEIETPEQNLIQPDALIAKLSSEMSVPIITGGAQAYYRPAEDKIHMPPIEAFSSANAYNVTVLHELAHATGAEKRLNRNIVNTFGTENYAKEELVAEISACMMSCDLIIPEEPELTENHKAYVQSWITSIKKKPDALYTAVTQAKQAAAYMDEKAGLVKTKVTVKQTEKDKEPAVENAGRER